MSMYPNQLPGTTANNGNNSEGHSSCESPERSRVLHQSPGIPAPAPAVLAAPARSNPVRHTGFQNNLPAHLQLFSPSPRSPLEASSDHTPRNRPAGRFLIQPRRSPRSATSSENHDLLRPTGSEFLPIEPKNMRHRDQLRPCEAAVTPLGDDLDAGKHNSEGSSSTCSSSATSSHENAVNAHTQDPSRIVSRCISASASQINMRDNSFLSLPPVLGRSVSLPSYFDVARERLLIPTFDPTNENSNEIPYRHTQSLHPAPVSTEEGSYCTTAALQRSLDWLSPRPDRKTTTRAIGGQADFGDFQAEHYRDGALR